MRLTYGSQKAIFADVLEMCATDTRVMRYVNQAMERLLWLSSKQVTYVRLAVVTTANMLTWPRVLETVELAAVNDQPITVHNGWFEFLEAGQGLVDTTVTSGFTATLLDRPGSAVKRDITATNQKVRLLALNAADNGKRALVQGLDANGNPIRTLDGSVWVEGEYVTANTSPANSTNIFTAITGVQKDSSNLDLVLQQVDATSGAVVELSRYAPDETTPWYRRSFVPGAIDLKNVNSQTVVTVIGRARHVPVSSDRDYLIPPNVPAIKNMLLDILKEERDRTGAEHAGRAAAFLQAQGAHQRGAGVVEPMRIRTSAFGGGDL